MNIHNTKNLLNTNYSINIEKVELFREGGNLSYIVYDTNQSYFMKIFRTPFLESATLSIDVQLYLLNKQFPVIPIIFTKSDSPFVRFTENSINYIIVLFDYIPGEEPASNDTMEVGELVGLLHKAMEEYPGSLPIKGKEFFIDRYVSIMREVNYPKTEWFQSYGNELWDKVKILPQGYCHCDLYRGNINKAKKNDKLYIMDFDTSCIAFSTYDIALFCNDTDYFNFDENGYERTRKRLAEFLIGYQKHRSLSQEEISAFYYLIAVYHFQLQATIIELYGLNDNQSEFFDRQYEWLLRREDICR